jgi:hypothetical protein
MEEVTSQSRARRHSHPFPDSSSTKSTPSDSDRASLKIMFRSSPGSESSGDDIACYGIGVDRERARLRMVTME